MRALIGAAIAAGIYAIALVSICMIAVIAMGIGADFLVLAMKDLMENLTFGIVNIPR